MLRVAVVGEKGHVVASGIGTGGIAGQLARRPGDDAIPYEQGPDTGFNVAFERSIRAFVEKSQGASNPAATGHDGYAVLAIERALVISQAEGRTVQLAEFGGAAAAATSTQGGQRA